MGLLMFNSMRRPHKVQLTGSSKQASNCQIHNKQLSIVAIQTFVQLTYKASTPREVEWNISLLKQIQIGYFQQKINGQTLTSQYHWQCWKLQHNIKHIIKSLGKGSGNPSATPMSSTCRNMECELNQAKYGIYKTLCSTTFWFYGNIEFHLCQERKFKEIE